MLPALLILIFAWALATTTKELATAEFLTGMLGDYISPYAMPVVIFVLSAVISFSTGSSWSTMAILYPISIPTTWAVCHAANLGPDISMQLLLNVLKNAHESGSDPALIRLFIQESPQQLTIEVQDAGGGLSAEVLEHALLPFYTIPLWVTPIAPH